jgi:hypothetical protein
MEYYVVRSTDLLSIANIIRNKGTNVGTISYPLGFIDAINNKISIAVPRSMYQNITIKESSRTITPTAPYNCLSSVKISPDNYLVGSGVPRIAGMTIIPSTVDYVINSGQFTTGSIIIPQ